MNKQTIEISLEEYRSLKDEIERLKIERNYFKEAYEQAKSEAFQLQRQQWGNHNG
jgi:PHD/YefM family antitoxin component YafN of YafNO toxin-antitoxin module